jgi:hypothetical protein
MLGLGMMSLYIYQILIGRLQLHFRIDHLAMQSLNTTPSDHFPLCTHIDLSVISAAVKYGALIEKAMNDE